MRFMILPGTVLAAMATAGCQSIDGIYRPGCVAFAGDEIELDGGRYLWDRFTDQVRVDERGEVVDPFPDYPREGSYRLEKDRLLLEASGSGPRAVFHLLSENGRYRLLDEDQRQRYLASGEVDPCALLREDDTGD